MIITKIVNLDDDWDAKLLEFNNWNIFQTSTWVTNYQKIYYPNAKSLGLFIYEDNSLVGLIPLIKANLYFIKVVGSPIRHSLTPFMGFAFQEGKFETCFNALLDYAKSMKANILSLTQGELFPNNVRNIKYSQINTYTTSVISLLQTEDELWKKIDSKTRNQIRKGEKNNFNISFDISPEIINSYLELRTILYQKQGMEYELSNRFLLNMFNKLPKKSIQLLTIEYENKLISAGVFLLFNKTCYYWDGVSKAEYNKLCPNNVIQWFIIKWAKSNGFYWYDLGGTNTPSIAHFKKGYGGITKEYNSVQIFRPEILSKIWNYWKQKTIKKNPRLNKD
ncbi:MAG: GNAT family N-acetyltransferase [Ignavibacteria bacterium]|nr:GNAT family N-acetyltransferase [Ignavibacteria bacterium]